MRVKSKPFILLMLLTLLFLLIPTEASAQEIGIAISGPLVSGSSFDVVPGQRIESYIRIENTGLVPQNITFASDMTKGVLGGIVTRTPPSVMTLLPESAAIGNVTFEIQPEASVFSEILIRVTAAGFSEDNESIVHASASARIRFRLSNDSVSLHVRTLDQWNWPVPDLDISISKEHLQYRKQRTDENGSTTFILAAGLYRVRVYDNLSVLAEAVLNITDDRYFEFHIYRGLQVTTPPTFHLVELFLGLGLGYFLHWFRVKKRSRSAEDELLEWGTSGLVV